MVPQYSHLKQVRWKNLPSALSRSITYTRLRQKKHTSLPPMLVGNSFLREPCVGGGSAVLRLGKQKRACGGEVSQLGLQKTGG